MVTIGIPFFNDSRYLDMAIRSVFNQSYQNWILILIDDGSTDGSLDIAYKYSEDPRVKVVSDGLNKKLPARLNQLIDFTETKYFARMDADDIMHPERLATQLAILEKNPDIDVLGSNAYTIDENNKITGLRKPASDSLITVSSFIHPSVMAKTSWYKSNKYDEDAIRVEDAVLWHSTRQHSVFKEASQPLLFYREVAGGYYKKYWGSSKGLLSLLKNGRYEAQFLLTKSLMSWIKGNVYYMFSLFDSERWLINKRNRGVLSKASLFVKDDVLTSSVK